MFAFYFITVFLVSKTSKTEVPYISKTLYIYCFCTDAEIPFFLTIRWRCVAKCKASWPSCQRLLMVGPLTSHDRNRTLVTSENNKDGGGRRQQLLGRHGSEFFCLICIYVVCGNIYYRCNHV